MIIRRVELELEEFLTWAVRRTPFPKQASRIMVGINEPVKWKLLSSSQVLLAFTGAALEFRRKLCQCGWFIFMFQSVICKYLHVVAALGCCYTLYCSVWADEETFKPE